MRGFTYQCGEREKERERERERERKSERTRKREREMVSTARSSTCIVLLRVRSLIHICTHVSDGYEC